MGKHLPYLVQERDGEDPHVYAWTAALAQKPGMRPITSKEAKEIQERLEEKHAARFQSDVTEDPEEVEDVDLDDEHDNELLSKMEAADKEQVDPAGQQPKPLAVSQEDIFDEDFRQVKKFRKTSSIEEYVLKKYKIDMIPMEKLGDMQEQAREILTSLMKNNSLYKID